MKQIGSHIFQGFKFAVPIIIIYSILLAIDNNVLNLGGFPDLVYLLVIPVLTAAIANSITSKILIVPALILGYFLEQFGIGFIGGILGGLLIGHSGLLLVKVIHVKQTWLILFVGYIVIAFCAFIVSYGVMIYVVGPPILWMLEGITNLILDIEPTEIMLLVAILATLTTIDLGGPFNKLAFGFLLQFYIDGYWYITGPALISVAIPPMAVYVALKVMPRKFNKEDHTSKKLAFFASLVGLTEGALPVSFRRPHKMIPIIVIGSVIGSVFAAYFHLENQLLMASLLGLIGASNIVVYILAHVIGVVVILILFYVILKDRKEQLHV